MINVGHLQASIGMDTRPLAGGATKAEALLRGFSSRISTMMGGATAAAAKMGAVLAGIGVGVGFVKFLHDVVKAGSEFEQTMATVGGVMRATAEEQDMLAASARHMGETTEWTATQAGQALQFLGMAGFNAAKSMAALPGTLDLATAGGIDLGRAADIATNALTAMGLPVGDLTRVNDVFIGTITRSNTNMEMMAESFKYAAPLAHAFGYSVEELAGMIGILGNAGIQGSMAGTQLAMAMQQANEVANKFGFESGDLIDVLDEMNKRGFTSADVMREFGQRAGRAALVLRDATKETRDMQRTLQGTEGEAKKLADTMRGTFAGSMKILKSVIESTMIDAFDRMKDALRDYVESATEWIRRHKDDIIALVGAAVDSFDAIVKSVEAIVDTIGRLAGGLTSFYGHLRDESAKTAEAVVDDAERMTDAYVPPPYTPWLRFVLFMHSIGNQLVDDFVFAVKAMEIAWATFTQSKLSELEALANAAAGFLRIIQGASQVIAGNIVEGGNTIMAGFADIKKASADLWDSYKGLGSAAIKSIEDAWDEYARNFGEHSKGIRKQFEQMYMTPQAFGVSPASAEALTSDQIDEMFWSSMQSLGAPRPAKQEGFSKPAIPEAFPDAGDQDKSEKRLQRTRDYTSQQLREQIGLLDQQSRMYAELLSDTKMTTDLSRLYWGNYYEARKRQIEAERQLMIHQGVQQPLANTYAQKQLQDLDAEYSKFFRSMKDKFTDFALEAADSMASVFEDHFFKALTFQFDKFSTLLKDLWTALMRQIASQAARDLNNIFKNLLQSQSRTTAIPVPLPAGMDYGGGATMSTGSGIPIPEALPMDYTLPEFASGGIVMGPTLAKIGESGPEAVVPFNRLNDPAFLKKIGAPDSAETHPNVQEIHFHIHTEDVAGFQRNASQIASKLALVVNRAGRRNL